MNNTSKQNRQSELRHWGVKGMRWGIRKDDNSHTTPTSGSQYRSNSSSGNSGISGVTRLLGREFEEAGRDVAKARSDYETGKFKDPYFHDLLSKKAMAKIDADLDVLTSKVERWERAHRSESLSGMNMNFNTYSDRRLEKLSAARESCSRLMSAIGDITVPSSELSEMCSMTRSSLSDLAKEYDYM